MVISISGGRKRPRFEVEEKRRFADYLAYKREQAQRGVAKALATKAVDPTRYSEESKKHWERVIGVIDWLAHGLGNTAMR